jgi:hypothetical protein
LDRPSPHDSSLPEAAVCDEHQERPAGHLVAAPDGRGDSYLCEDCFRDYRQGRPLPLLRHSPAIRRRAATEPRRRKPASRWTRPSRGSGPLEDDPAVLRALFGFAHESVALIDSRGAIRTAVGPPGGVLGHTDRAGILQYVHPEDLSFAYDRLAEIASPGSEVSFEIRARHLDGSFRRLRIDAFNRLDDPVLGGLVVVSRLLEP